MNNTDKLISLPPATATKLTAQAKALRIATASKPDSEALFLLALTEAHTLGLTESCNTKALEVLRELKRQLQSLYDGNVKAALEADAKTNVKDAIGFHSAAIAYKTALSLIDQQINILKPQ